MLHWGAFVLGAAGWSLGAASLGGGHSSSQFHDPEITEALAPEQQHENEVWLPLLWLQAAEVLLGVDDYAEESAAHFRFSASQELRVQDLGISRDCSPVSVPGADCPPTPLPLKIFE